MSRAELREPRGGGVGWNTCWRGPGRSGEGLRSAPRGARPSHTGPPGGTTSRARRLPPGPRGTACERAPGSSSLHRGDRGGRLPRGCREGCRREVAPHREGRGDRAAEGPPRRRSRRGPCSARHLQQNGLSGGCDLSSAPLSPLSPPQPSSAPPQPLSSPSQLRRRRRVCQGRLKTWGPAVGSPGRAALSQAGLAVLGPAELTETWYLRDVTSARILTLLDRFECLWDGSSWWFCFWGCGGQRLGFYGPSGLHSNTLVFRPSEKVISSQIHDSFNHDL